VDGELLLTLTDQNLQSDCGVTNGIHRQKLLRAIAQLRAPS